LAPKHDGASNAFSETSCFLLPDRLHLRLGLLSCCGARQSERRPGMIQAALLGARCLQPLDSFVQIARVRALLFSNTAPEPRWCDCYSVVTAAHVHCRGDGLWDAGGRHQDPAGSWHHREDGQLPAAGGSGLLPLPQLQKGADPIPRTPHSDSADGNWHATQRQLLHAGWREMPSGSKNPGSKAAR